MEGKDQTGAKKHFGGQRRTVAQGLIEYALILLLGAVVVILVLRLLGFNLRDAYCKVVGGLGGGGYCSHYCTDNFADSSGWTTTNKLGWQASNGQFCNAANNEQQAFNTCSQDPNVLPKNYVVRLENANLLSGNGYGVFFRLQGTSPVNGYAFQYDPGLPGFVIRKWVNGWEVNPALAYKAAPGYSWYNTPRKMEVYVQGNTYNAYADGVLVLTATDSTFPTGGAGLRTWDSTRVCMSGFSIDPIP
jgi:Flp pilus assembly pilin Flp